MTVQTVVTETRVIVSDEATKEQLAAIAAKHPGKSVIRAASMKPGFVPEDNKSASQIADLKSRVNKLETLVQELLAAKNVRTVVMTEAPAAPVVVNAVSGEITEPEGDATIEETRAFMANGFKEPKVAKAPKVSNQEPANETGDKYDVMDKERLIRLVTKRGGNPAKIMAPFHARARTIALRVWLRKNPAKKPAAPVAAAKKPAKANIAAKVRRAVARR